MNAVDTIHLIVEASLALAGFAGIVTVLSTRSGSKLSSLVKLNLTNLLSTSLGALFLALIALILLAASLQESQVWRVISGAGLLLTLYFSMFSIRTVHKHTSGAARSRSNVTLWAINLPLLLVCCVQVWNVLTAGQFWAVLLLLAALFAVGCYSFVRLIFSAG